MTDKYPKPAEPWIEPKPRELFDNEEEEKRFQSFRIQIIYAVEGAEIPVSYKTAVFLLQAIERLHADADRAWAYVESQFDHLTADELANLSRARGENVEGKADEVRAIFRRAYERVTGEKS